MIEYPFLYCISLVLLLAFDLLTAASRAALVNSSIARLLTQRDERPQPVNRLLALLAAPQRLQSSLGLARSLAWMGLASLILVFTLNFSWEFALGDVAKSNIAADIVAAIILLLFGVTWFWVEWLTIQWVCRRPEAWAFKFEPFARLVFILFAPLVSLPVYLSRNQFTDQEGFGTVTEAELKSMVDASHEDGVLEQEERKMIFSIFSLGDTLVREIMVPRIYLTALDITIPLSQAVDELLKSKYSRVPVYEESVDNILGVLYVKDLLRVIRAEGNENETLRSLLRPAYFVPEAKKVDELLAEMQAQHIHMAIVVDEYGGVAGLVTLEDIVEEIVGEIQDEFDQSEELPYQKISDGEYIFQGRIGLNDFNELMDSELPSDEAETLGGFIYSQIGRAPASGESLPVGDLLLTVEHVTGRRIRKVHAQKKPSSQEAKHEENQNNG